MVVDMTKTFRGSQKQGSHSTALICHRWSSSTMLWSRRARDQMFFWVPPRTGGSALISFEMRFLCLRRKRKTEKDPLFLWPIRGLTLIIIPVTDQNWELLILIIVLLRWRFISGWGGLCQLAKDKIDCIDRQPIRSNSCRCPANVTRHSLMWNIGLAVPSEFSHQIVALLVLSAYLTLVSCLVMPLFFFWHAISHFSQAWTETPLAGDPSRQFAAHHMRPFKATKSKGQLPPDESVSTPWETDIWTAAHTTNRSQDLTQYGRENIRSGPLSGRCYPIISLCPEQVMAFLQK